jgi:predicted CXXCH cytochrome family protein
VPASKVGWDQVGDFRTSPHRTGPDGYLGICEDCHDPHGTEHAANLALDPYDNTLCTTCHVSDFPDEAAEADHAHHSDFDPAAWSPGSCTGCHLPRVGIEIRPDAVSGAGELHSHVLTFALPELSIAEFDAASATVLPRGEVPLPACLDCHLQADALAEDAGSNCPCPVGDPTRRETYEGMQTIFDLVWGSP